MLLISKKDRWPDNKRRGKQLCSPNFLYYVCNLYKWQGRYWSSERKQSRWPVPASRGVCFPGEGGGQRLVLWTRCAVLWRVRMSITRGTLIQITQNTQRESHTVTAPFSKAAFSSRNISPSIREKPLCRENICLMKRCCRWSQCLWYPGHRSAGWWARKKAGRKNICGVFF